MGRARNGQEIFARSAPHRADGTSAFTVRWRWRGRLGRRESGLSLLLRAAAGLHRADHQTLAVVIGGDSSWTGTTEGGVSMTGAFYLLNKDNTAYVFPKDLNNGDPKLTALGAIHEAGHGFGLSHQSVYSGSSKTQE